jgi:tetratricopeptide (TPR) repeat protein
MPGYAEKGLLLLQLGHYSRAESELAKGLTEAPDSALLHAILALCRSMQNKHGPAVADANSAIVLDPDMAYAHYALAYCLYRADKTGAAMAAITEALRLDSEDADFWALKSNIHLELAPGLVAGKSLHDALQCADNGLRFDALNKQCCQARAQALHALGRKDEARTAILASLAFDPENSNLHQSRAWMLLCDGDASKARLHYEEALRLDPDSENARQGLVASLRAKRLVYRFLLKMMLPNGTVRVGTLVFLFLAPRIVASLGQMGNPLLYALSMAIIVPVVAGTLFMLLLMLIANPLFNLFLKFDPAGPAVLTSDESLAANLIGACLLAVMITVLLAMISGNILWYFSTAVFLMLVLPVVMSFESPPGGFRKFMYIYLGADVIAAIVGTVVLLNCDFLESRFKGNDELITQILSYSLSASFVLSIVSILMQTLIDLGKEFRRRFFR